jgi:hypothetical protein
MGAKIEYYCLECGETLTEKPAGQCPSCQCPYDLRFNITYSIFPRSSRVKAAIDSLILSFIFAFFYSLAALNITLVLTGIAEGLFVMAAGTIFFISIWLTSLKIRQITSLITFAVGYCWGLTLAVALVAGHNNMFLPGTNAQIILRMCIALPIVLFLFLLPLRATRRFEIRRWRAKAMAAINQKSGEIFST